MSKPNYHIDIFAEPFGQTTDIRVYGPHPEGGAWKTAKRMGRPAAKKFPEAVPVCIATTMEDAEMIVSALNPK